MPLEQIISIIVFVLVLVLIWGVFKKLFKIMFYAGILISLLLAANLYFIYLDFKDLRENFGVSEKKVILVDGNEVLTGLLMGEDTELLTNTQLRDYSSSLRNKDYEDILGDSYKLMVFDISIIENLDKEIEIEDIKITTDEAAVTLKSDTSEPNEKASLFSVILADEIITSKNPLFFFSEFKDGNIIIYPETALFKTVKLIPLSFIRDVGEKIFEKSKEKVKTFIVEEIE